MQKMTLDRPPLTPKEPASAFLESYLVDSLRNSRAYHIDAPGVTVKLDQNEVPWDLQSDFKKHICAKVAQTPWNRYPAPYPDHLAQLVARYAGVAAENVLLGPGSNFLITLLMDNVVRNLKGKVIISRPSFPLYESQCSYTGIPFEIWPGGKSFELDPTLLPKNIPAGSVVAFASPNNPTGSVLSSRHFEQMLKDHPQSLFIADEAYFEFSEDPFTELLGRYSNFVIVRTFSKAFGGAGVRVGYLLGPASFLKEIKKLRLPYLMNHWSVIATTEILQTPEALHGCQQHIAQIISERNRVFAELHKLAAARSFEVFPSEANFLLVRWPTQDACAKAYSGLIQDKILVRNVSGAPTLSGCLRITIGTEKENNVFLHSAQNRF